MLKRGLLDLFDYGELKPMEISLRCVYSGGGHCQLAGQLGGFDTSLVVSLNGSRDFTIDLRLSITRSNEDS